jgi:hypothetical protein
MTYLDGNVWLSLAAPRNANGAGKAADGGFPPYNVELLSGHDNGSEALRRSASPPPMETCRPLPT